ncbi:MAG: hypothetical protein OXB84_02125, partial [Halobacteriovoraceae bacterium]|nr:hypothetical protein [Halobacteriovoraceae bacterium]
MTRRILYLFLILAPLWVLAEEHSCEEWKQDLHQIGQEQLSLRQNGKTLLELQRQLDKTQAKIIIMEGIKELKVEYLDFIRESQAIKIDESDLSKIDDFKATLKKGVLASKRISAVYNYLKIYDEKNQNIVETCNQVRAEAGEGSKICEILESSNTAEQNKVNETLKGLIRVLNMAHREDPNNKAQIKEYIDSIDQVIPKDLLEPEVINKIQTAEQVLNSIDHEYDQCVNQGKQKSECFRDIILFGKDTVEEVSYLTQSINDPHNNLDKVIFRSYTEDT